MNKTYSLLIAASLLLIAACDTKEKVKVINTDQTEGQTTPSISAAEGTKAPAAATNSADTNSVKTSLGLMNEARPMDGLITSGQPTKEQFEELRTAGVTKVISLRTDAEPVGFDAGPMAMREKLVFKQISIAGPDDLTRENVDALAAELEGAEGNVLLYCGSSNRVGAMLALKAKWVDGKSTDEALAIGKTAGLTALEDAVKAKLAE